MLPRGQTAVCWFSVKPAKCLVQIAAAAHHGDAKARFSFDVWISEPKVLVGLRVCPTHAAGKIASANQRTFTLNTRKLSSNERKAGGLMAGL